MDDTKSERALRLLRKKWASTVLSKMEIRTDMSDDDMRELAEFCYRMADAMITVENEQWLARQRVLAEQREQGF
jgi:hypothetical protein